MHTIGKLKSISRDIITRKILITFECEEINAEELNSLAEKELSIEVGKKTKKRSLSANNYFHKISDSIAEALTISKAKSKNILICRYGQPFLLEDGSPIIYKTNAPAEYMCEQEDVHWKPIKFAYENGKEVIFYKAYRGSHTYNSLEMSKLIDGTIADAKELGIETLPPTEIERMKSLWKNGDK